MPLVNLPGMYMYSVICVHRVHTSGTFWARRPSQQLVKDVKDQVVGRQLEIRWTHASDARPSLNHHVADSTP